MNQQKQPSNDSTLEKAKKMAGSPAGQQLYTLLQQQGGDEFRRAMEQASAGDLTAARQVLSKLMTSQEAQKLLQQLGR